MFSTENSSSSNSSDQEVKIVKRALFRKKRGCPLLAAREDVSYKNPDLLSKFTSDGGRILPRRITGVCAKNQKKLKGAVKIARFLSLLQF
ncbi:30S ribosomal protein S18 [Candidatus Sneabacter namystus]|uniref:30S ribosomal protein S18 n=1 Tax=Candidatus Sneabacter namystus TaxID=2601646 RepID=A0A5C0UHP5_9RICK|nr:30S ribosomal protein S18 [Candidatus Sneabacter namystus]QEK39546.1 30S ribosomal protein S18 [Candidatus Sneabacter namystus]